MIKKAVPLTWLKPGVFVGSLTPLVVLSWRGLSGTLGANPISTALNQFGLVALIFLIASLACTPVKTWTGWTWPLRLRKMLGLYGFFYACLHLLTYVALDQVFDLPVIVEDVFSRPFIIIGFLAFCMLVPLAVTSTSGWVRRLGKRWQKLHKLAYVIVILGAVHFFMRMKSDVTQPVVYGSAVAVLLGTRIMVAVRKQKKS